MNRTPLFVPSPDRRLESVNVLRGVICLSVMGQHFAYLFTDPSVVVEWLIRFHPAAECFMVISGYTIAAIYHPKPTDLSFSVPGLVGRRLLILLGPYWAAVTLVYLIPLWRLLAIASWIPNPEVARLPEVTFFDVVLNLTGTSDIFARPPVLFTFWSLATLLQLHVIWAGLFWVIRQGFLWRKVLNHHANTLLVLHVLVFLAGVLSVGLSLRDDAPHEPVNSHWWHLPFWFYFVAVGWGAYWATKEWRWLMAGVPFALILVAVLTSSPRPFFAAATAVGLVLVTRHPTALAGRVWGPLRAVGRWSYSVYLVHGIVGYRVMTALTWAGVPQSGGWAVLHFAAGAVASVACAYGFHRLVETPVRRLASGIRYRTGAGAPDARV